MNLIFASFFLLLGAGALWHRLSNVPSPQEMRRAISAIVLRLLLPMLTFQVIAQAPLNAELWKIPVIAASSSIICAVAAIVIYTASKRFLFRSMDKKSIGAMILGAGWCNATYLGLPVITAIIGEDYRRIPLLFDLLALTPLLWTFGAGIAGHYGAEGGFGGIWPLLRRGLHTMLRLPPLYGVAAGILVQLLGIQVPGFILKACMLAGNAVPPIMMISVGMALTMPDIHSIVRLLPALLIRLAGGPAIAIAGIYILGLEGPAAKAVLLEAGMPTMVLTLAVSDTYKLDSGLLAQLIAVSTALSLLTLQFLQ
jgi:predicted permease